MTMLDSTHIFIDNVRLMGIDAFMRLIGKSRINHDFGKPIMTGELFLTFRFLRSNMLNSFRRLYFFLFEISAGGFLC